MILQNRQSFITQLPSSNSQRPKKTTCYWELGIGLLGVGELGVGSFLLNDSGSGDALKIRTHAVEPEAPARGGQFADAVFLPESELHHEPPPAHERTSGGVEYRFDRDETLTAAEQRHRRFVQHASRERGLVPFFDIWRVRDDQVELVVDVLEVA